MATANQQVVYAMATPPHGVVQYEYYTHQMPQSTSAYATSVPVQYSGSVPPPPPGAAAAAEQNGDGVAKRAADEGTQFLLRTVRSEFCDVRCLMVINTRLLHALVRGDQSGCNANALMLSSISSA